MEDERPRTEIRKMGWLLAPYGTTAKAKELITTKPALEIRCQHRARLLGVLGRFKEVGLIPRLSGKHFEPC